MHTFPCCADCNSSNDGGEGEEGCAVGAIVEYGDWRVEYPTSCFAACGREAGELPLRFLDEDDKVVILG